MGVAGFGSGNQLAVQIVQGRKQGDGSVALVVVGSGAGLAPSPEATPVGSVPGLGTDSSRHSKAPGFSQADGGTIR